MIDKRLLLGNAGEKIVANYLNKQKIFVEHSVDPYDNQKDLKINGKHLEVKTQVPFITKRCFTIKDNHQLKKCQNADYFVFVQAPCSKLDEAGIYQVDKGFEFYRYTTKKGLKMILIPMEQPAIEKMFTIEGEDKEILRRYATPF
tara:strand:- start:952 stop:1386 length:435 start_codon:yes stop_codon:yes gene_type:complete